MDRLTSEVRQESMMFADDIMIYSENREQVEENLQRLRYALERGGIIGKGAQWKLFNLACAGLSCSCRASGDHDRKE